MNPTSKEPESEVKQERGTPEPDIPKIMEWRPPDLNQFYSLMDRGDEDFLRRMLGRAEFCRFKRSRIRVQWEYVRRIAHDSAIVRRSAIRARLDPDVNVAKTAGELADLASQVRVQCRIALAKLAVEYMFPRIHLRRDKN